MAKIDRRYGLQIVRACPAVVSMGITVRSVVKDLQQHRPLANLPSRAGSRDPVLVIGIRTGSTVPRGPMFLDGVPVYFYSSGQFTY